MASSIPCDICEAESAILIVSSTLTGDTQGVGANCAERWAKAFAKGFADAAKAQRDQAKAAKAAELAELEAAGLLDPGNTAAVEAAQEAVEAAEGPTAADGPPEAPIGAEAAQEAAQEAESTQAGPGHAG